MMKTALISVYDKEGIVEFAKHLHNLGIKILSTGGTAKLLKKNKIPTILISDYIKSKEMFDGRVKSLHPKIYAGILALRNNKKHMQELKKNKIDPIDIVAVNLYPFEETIGKKASFKEAIENIDIGGPTLVRAAAKNFNDVLIIVDPKDYNNVLKEIKKGKISETVRENLALKAFDSTKSNFITYFYQRANAKINNFIIKKHRNIHLPDTYSISLEQHTTPNKHNPDKHNPNNVLGEFLTRQQNNKFQHSEKLKKLFELMKTYLDQFEFDLCYDHYINHVNLEDLHKKYNIPSSTIF